MKEWIHVLALGVFLGCVFWTLGEIAASNLIF